MPNPFKTEKFKNLQSKWYKKLANSKFKDIETADGQLREFHYRIPLIADPIKARAKEEYYRLAGQFLHDHAFASKTEAYIWELHSQAISIRNIVKRLRNKKGIKTHKRHIHETIQRLASEMINIYRRGVEE